MIFPVLELEDIIQVNDKTRLDGTKSYITPDEAAITSVRIEPETGAGFIDVTDTKYLDYQYSTDGVKTVTIEVGNGGPVVTVAYSLDIISEEDDKLFSDDKDLIASEPNILNYVRKGRNSFLDKHREAQHRILTWLDENRIWTINCDDSAEDGNRLTKDHIVNLEEVHDWSKYLTLKIIFKGVSNSIGDIFEKKSQDYAKLAAIARNRAKLRLDRDGDGTIDKDEEIDYFIQPVSFIKS